MSDLPLNSLEAFERGTLSRRQLLLAMGAAAIGAPLSAALAQGRCIRSLGSPACDTTAVKAPFEPTGWKTVLLDHLTIQVADYKKEAAFYIALMGWKLRDDDGTRAIMDIDDLCSVSLKQAPAGSPLLDTASTGRAGGSGRGGTPSHSLVESFCWGIEPWNAKAIERQLRKRGLDPIADNDGKQFESFHVKDPDGFDLQISNGTPQNRHRGATTAKTAAPAPFESTGWKTVWLDHLSFSTTNYKESAAFYCNLLGWKPTYDEGSQNECMIGDVGDIIIRGGNPLAPSFGRGGRGGNVGGARRARIDHISFGIDPWDTDGVKSELEKRGLSARVDTSTGDEIHVAAFKSYHTFTPNGFNLQISAVNHDTRLTLANAVKPRLPG